MPQQRDHNPGNYGRQNTRQVFNLSRFNPAWISSSINKDSVDFAEEAGKYLAENRLTTSQIRNVFGELKRIQMKGFDSEKTAFLLLKPKMAYAAKRNQNDGINTFKELFNLGHEAVVDNITFINFISLIEAVLAYHKAFGGREN
jgi:CRISPR-associated protein Csm2